MRRRPVARPGEPPDPFDDTIPVEIAADATASVLLASGEHHQVDDNPWRPVNRPTAADRTFRAICTGAAMISLVIVAATLIFLLKEGWSAIWSSGPADFFFGSTWNPSAGRFGVGGLLLGTIIIASLAIVVAVPLGVGMALFINEYAPARLRSLLTSVVDLLAALPSLIFGLWGFFVLQGQLQGVAVWMESHLSAIPLFRFKGAEPSLGNSSFIAGMVVGIMILPIITSISRDVMAQVPREQCEGALALGGTRWGMIRAVILPFGRVGITGATLLGFGRALGETIAVAVIISLVFDVNWHVLETGGGSVASLIATRFGEAGPEELDGLIAAGFALFVLTLGVNLAARRIVARAGRLA